MENYRKILQFPRKSIERLYLSKTIFACPRLCQIYGRLKIGNVRGFPSKKCRKYLHVHHNFYLSLAGGQSVISIPGIQAGFMTAWWENDVTVEPWLKPPLVGRPPCHLDYFSLFTFRFPYRAWFGLELEGVQLFRTRVSP